MTNLEISKARIEAYSESNNGFLSLANLGITTNEFMELIPSIVGIESLKKLDVSGNNLGRSPR